MFNYGASLGINFPGLMVFQALMMVGVGWIWLKEKKAWGCGLILLGGGLNLAEKLKWGGVWDYWRIPGTNIYNNINDYLIGVGLVQLLWYFLWKTRQK